MITKELKPCPFCGGRVLDFLVQEWEDGYYGQIECQYCGACVSFGDGKNADDEKDTREFVASLWNSRRRK